MEHWTFFCTLIHADRDPTEFRGEGLLALGVFVRGATSEMCSSSLDKAVQRR
jgi:hypothetical protein